MIKLIYNVNKVKGIS